LSEIITIIIFIIIIIIVSATCAGSRWQLDQLRPLHVITTVHHVLHTSPLKLLRAFISLAAGYFASTHNADIEMGQDFWPVTQHDLWPHDLTWSLSVLKQYLNNGLIIIRISQCTPKDN